MAEANTFSEYAFVSIGSNLPMGIRTPLDIIAFAFEQLELLSPAPNLYSSIYITSPVDSPAGTPDFYNAMAGFLPLKDETALSLLYKLQAIEIAAGRQRIGEKNSARTLDLDLITFKDEVSQEMDLVLPHPRARERRFVLEPFIEIAGKEYVLPGGGVSLQELLIKISGEQLIRKI